MLLLIILASAAGLYLLIVVAAALISLRPPRIPAFMTPGVMGYGYSSIEIPARDGVELRGWHVPVQNAKGVIIALHGYMVNRCEWAVMLPVLREAGWTCVFMDLRGQGRSGKAAVTFGLNECDDAELVLEWCQKEHPGLPIVFMGSSMGAAAAVFASDRAKRKPDGLILDGAYRSFDEAGKGWWIMIAGRWLDIVLKPVLPIGSIIAGIKPASLSVEKVLPRIQDVPMLLCYGTADPIVPLDSVKALEAAAGPNARLELFEGAGHGHARFREPDRFNAAVIDFLSLIYFRSHCNNCGDSSGHNGGAPRQDGLGVHGQSGPRSVRRSNEHDHR